VQLYDKISFRSPGFDLSVCHRVIEIEENGLVTRGDNNNHQDNFLVTEEYFVR